MPFLRFLQILEEVRCFCHFCDFCRKCPQSTSLAYKFKDPNKFLANSFLILGLFVIMEEIILVLVFVIFAIFAENAFNGCFSSFAEAKNKASGRFGMSKFILAIDSGTTSCRAIIFNEQGEIEAQSQQETSQIFPKSGWVEQDAMSLWGKQSGVIQTVLEKSGIRRDQIKAIGITNQRETTVIWDKNTGRPICNAIVWQCRRTAPLCNRMKAEGLEDMIREKTGLVIDAYFSATKIHWILNHVEGAKEKAQNGDLLFGTVDTWLIWNLTRGQVHCTDMSNASRTMLFNINTLDWDQDILDYLEIPRSILPQVVDSSGICAYTHSDMFGGVGIPIAGIAGDQQAALFGQACFAKGMVKNTYGTGCFVLMNTGSEKVKSKNGLLTTIAWKIGEQVTYALEGSVFVAGAAIQWLRDELRLIYDAPQTEYYANKIEDSGGVYVVPAFTGLGAPYWDMYARGGVFGLTRGTKREHMVRATLEALAYQSRDVIDAMVEDVGMLESLRADGGASVNDFLMQFQADILGTEVARLKTTETTALGAAYLAGLAVGYWNSVEDIQACQQLDRQFTAEMSEETRQLKYKYWQKAVHRTMNWLEEEDSNV